MTDEGGALGPDGSDHCGGSDHAHPAGIDFSDCDGDRTGVPVVAAVTGGDVDSVAGRHRMALECPGEMAGAQSGVALDAHPARLREVGALDVRRCSVCEPGVLHGAGPEDDGGWGGDIPCPDHHMGAADLDGTAARKAHGGEDRGVGAGHGVGAGTDGESHGSRG